MSLRLEMLQVARLAPKLLGDSAPLVASFLDSQQTDGAFRDRSGQPDLYYTVFGLESLRALSVAVPVESTAGFLESFKFGDDLDLVHLSCLIRAWANLRRTLPGDLVAGLAGSLRKLQSAWHPETGTIYDCFLALGAYQDLRLEPPASDFLGCVESLRAGDGAYANHRGAPQGLTSTTAAAVAIMRQFEQSVSSGLTDWLLARRHSSGGFIAAPATPMPDLLSTATALHALTTMHVSLAEIRESTLDFVDSLWTNRGGFYGHWADDTLDCEYTYYGLLALGHLSL